jgi:hypothetical protein
MVAHASPAPAVPAVSSVGDLQKTVTGILELIATKEKETAELKAQLADLISTVNAALGINAPVAEEPAAAKPRARRRSSGEKSLRQVTYEVVSQNKGGITSAGVYEAIIKGKLWQSPNGKSDSIPQQVQQALYNLKKDGVIDRSEKTKLFEAVKGKSI